MEERFERYQKQITQDLNDKLSIVKHEQDSKIRDVHDQIKANTNKTCEIETRTNIIETKLEETSKTAKDCSGEMTNIKEEVKTCLLYTSRCV